MDDYVNAVRDYQSAIKQDPSYALSYYNAGNVYFKQRQFKQVLASSLSYVCRYLWRKSKKINKLSSLGTQLL